MRFCRCSLAGVTLVLCLMADLALAQPEAMPREVVTAGAQLSVSQRNIVADYVRQWTQKLVQGTPEEIRKSRRKLTEPLQAGGSEFFSTYYTAELSRQLRAVADDDRTVTRINVMIVGSKLNEAGAVDLIVQGLADENVAVRYWAAKAGGRLADRSSRDPQAPGAVTLSEADLTRLLKGLVQQLQAESAEQVLQQLIPAIAQINLPEAIPQLLTGLNERVDVHAKNPSLAMRAEMEGLRSLLVRMITAVGNNQAVPPDYVRQLALVAGRFMLLSTQVLDEGVTDRAQEAAYTDMVKLCDEVLGWAYKQSTSGAALPQQLVEPVGNTLQQRDWPKLRLRGLEWQQLLLRPPFRLEMDQLKVEPPAAE